MMWPSCTPLEVLNLVGCGARLRAALACHTVGIESTITSAQRSGNTKTCTPTSVNRIHRSGGCNFMKLREVIKQCTVINLYYLNFFGIVMLRPVLVTLVGGAWDDSPP
jgi:hypothetical protein